MNRYRIGRIVGQWVNFTPPIRGGIFIENTACNSPNAAWTDTVDQSLSPESSPPSTPIQNRKGFRSSSASAHGPTSTTSKSPEVSQHEPNNAEMVDQAHIDDLMEYPSLDPQTQQAIVQKYRTLHHTIQAEGFYDCKYGEYGKELIRYSGIFTCFLVALNSGWYITSAALLGLFWVCQKTNVSGDRTMADGT